MEESDNPFAATQAVIEVPTTRNQDDKERLYDNIDILRDWQQHTVEWIFSILGADGRELFCLHACAVLQQKEPTSSGKDIALDVWERMAEHHRRTWAEMTPQMLLEGTRGFEDLLSTNEPSELAVELRGMAERACTEHLERIDAEEIRKAQKKAQKKARRLEKQAQKEARRLEKRARNMDGRLQLLRTASKPPVEGADGEDTLMARFDSVNAKSMFCYHALPFVAQKLKGPIAIGKVEAAVLEMWNFAKHQVWEKMASGFLMAADHKAAKFLEAMRSTRRLEVSYERYQKQQLRTKAAFFAGTPVLDALVGFRVDDYSDAELIPQILRGVQDRVATNQAVTLYGRVRSARICYSPSKMDVTGIGARLRALRTQGSTASQYESLLRPFANWNSEIFPEISETTKQFMEEHVTKANLHRYHCQWLHHQQCYGSITPINKNNSSEIVAAVVRSVRARCEKVNPESLLLIPLREALTADQEGLEEADRFSQTKLQEWSLHSVSEGLGAQMVRCFKKDASPEEYEDYIETVLWRFKMKCPAAVFGRENAGLEVRRLGERLSSC